MVNFNISEGPKDLWTGLFYIALGAGAVFIARDYEMGSTLRMGAGYVPTLLGYALCVVGILAVLRAFLRRGERIEPLAWKALALVLGSVVVFGFLARGAGLLPAVFLLVVISAIASPSAKRIQTLSIAAGTAIFAWLVFTRALGVPLQALGSWFGY